MKLKRNALVWMYTVATWLLFGSNSSTVDDTNSLLKQYPTVSFTTDGATANSYRDFINAVRASLLSGGDERYGIPVLPNRDGLSMNRRFVLIGLTNQAELSITLALDVTNVYLVGYQAGRSAYFFRTDNTEDAQANTYLFTDAQTRQTLTFGGNYDRLEALANQRRENIELGIGPLEEAISALYFFSTGRTQIPALARSFMIIIQMIPEAVRYNYIEGEMRTRIRHNRRSAPDPSVITLENRWGRLSTEIQESNQGAFANQVQLQRRNGSPFYVSDVSTLIAIIALMVFRCAPPRQSSQFPLVIRPVVTDLNVDDDVCVDPEPIVRIIGRNGLCVDVKDGKFNDGNAIQLWTCSSHIAVNQLWTLKKDGTIQSNGKCLTTYGYSSGCYVMIYDCYKAEVDATKWQIWENRTIINPRSALVLAATSGNTGTILSVQTNSYASSQGWIPGNTTEPFVTSIVGLNDLCLQANGGSVWLEECASNNAAQQWALYADGSIRPQQNQNNCLTSDSGASKTIVKISSCSAGSSGQRWMFKNDGTIWNLQYELVLDVTNSDPSLKQIIIFPFHGDPNQLWLQVF